MGSFDAWVSAKFSFEYVGPHGRNEFLIKAVDKRRLHHEFGVQCFVDGTVNERYLWHPAGMTEPQRQAFKRALAKFVQECDAPGLVQAREKALAERVCSLRSNFLAGANLLIACGATPAEVRAMLDEHLVAHVHES